MKVIASYLPFPSDVDFILVYKVGGQNKFWFNWTSTKIVKEFRAFVSKS